MYLRKLLQLVAVLGLVSGCGGAAQDAPIVQSASAMKPQAVASTVPDGSVLNQVIDSYDPATRILTIPLVQVGARYYRDVQITVGTVLGVGVAKGPSGVFDSFDGATAQLTIPVVRIGSTLYTNALITVGAILSVGGPVDSYSVPTDLSQVSYPESYRTVTTDAADINTDPCNLSLSKINYPASWLGHYPLPAIQGAPLKTAIQRGVMLKDIGLQPGNPAFILQHAPGAPAGCAGDLHAALDRTIARVKALGSDFIDLTQWHWASNREDGSWYFTPADQTYGSMTDADLAYFAQKAHSAGLKVLVRNQIQGYFDRANPSVYSVPAPTLANLQNWFSAWRPYVAERAAFFQSIGIDIWELGCGACMYHDTGDGSAEAKALFASEYENSLAVRRPIFAGKSLLGDSPLLYDPPPGTSLATKIDIIQIGANVYNPPADLTEKLSVPYYRAGLSNVQGSINVYDPYGKTLLLVYYAQSRGDFFSLPGYMEETTCTAMGSLSTSADTCIERSTTTDFSLQAIVHEATLEAINAFTTSKSTLMVEVNDYWETDSLMPYTAFPNIATSFRNKPAEGIVKAWFAR
jgi:hypothetical protein